MTMDSDDFECMADLVHGHWDEAVQPVMAEMAALRRRVEALERGGRRSAVDETYEYAALKDLMGGTGRPLTDPYLKLPQSRAAHRQFIERSKC